MFLKNLNFEFMYNLHVINSGINSGMSSEIHSGISSTLNAEVYLDRSVDSVGEVERTRSDRTWNFSPPRNCNEVYLYRSVVSNAPML